MGPDYAVKYKNPLYETEKGKLEHFAIRVSAYNASEQSSVTVEKEFPTRRGMASAQEEARVLASTLKKYMGMSAEEIFICKISTGEEA